MDNAFLNSNRLIIYIYNKPIVLAHFIATSLLNAEGQSPRRIRLNKVQRVIV